MLSVADWGGGMSASCKPREQLFADATMDGRIVRCGIISSCQSAATCDIVKHFWSRTHVRSAIASTGPITDDWRITCRLAHTRLATPASTAY